LHRRIKSAYNKEVQPRATGFVPDEKLGADMRKIAILTVLTVGFAVAGLVYGASNSWKTKPYQQWDENDIKDVLTDSPWVKRTVVDAMWQKGPLNAPDESNGNAPSETSPQMPPRPGGAGGAQAGGGTPSGGSSGQGPVSEGASAAFFIRWSSSQTIREAIARDAVLNGRSSEAQAEQYVNQTPNGYEILVSGQDMTPFANETNDTLKLKAYMEVKPSKEKVSPANVQITKDVDGKKVVSVVFLFSKQGPNGQPLLASNDKQAQFDCKLKDMRLDAQFDLRKMTGKNGPDL
jgi:hypothetical protein